MLNPTTTKTGPSLNQVRLTVIAFSVAYVLYLIVTFPAATGSVAYVSSFILIALWIGTRSLARYPVGAAAIEVAALISMGVAAGSPITLIFLLLTRTAFHAYGGSMLYAFGVASVMVGILWTAIVTSGSNAGAGMWGPGTASFFVVAAVVHTLHVSSVSLQRALRSAAVSADLQARTAQIKAHLKAEGRFRSLIRNSADVILVLNPRGTIIFETPSAERLFGVGARGVLGRDLSGLVHPDDSDEISCLVGGLTQDDGLAKRSWRLASGEGAWLDCDVRIQNLIEDPDVNGLVLTIRDVTEQRAMQAELKRRASKDPLTGLANRTALIEHIDHALAASGRSETTPALVLLDIDDFKIVNDSLGHAIGDSLLSAVGHRIASGLDSRDLAARIGGDEFAVFYADVKRPGLAEQVAARLGRALARPFEVAGREIHVRASVGVAVPGPDDGAESVMRNADTAMYKAKGSGGGPIRTFHQSMRVEALDRLEVSEDLRRAIDRSELALAYQPIMDLRTGEVSSVEALMRWRHPYRGPVSPAEFIPIAEGTGLISRLGRWAVKTAISTMSTLEAQGCRLSVNVNLSPTEILEPDLERVVLGALDRYGIAPGRLTLEITEDVLVEEPEQTLKIMQRLKDAGVRLAIDDFGTGYSSLSYLQRFPFDVLKIDKAFVDGVAGSPEESAVARAIIRIGRALGRDLVAEGVERYEQVEALRALGCKLGQGYLCAVPMDVAELPGWMTKSELAREGTIFAARDRWSVAG